VAWWIPVALDWDQQKPSDYPVAGMSYPNLGYDAHEYWLSPPLWQFSDMDANRVQEWKNFVYSKGYGDFMYGEFGSMPLTSLLLGEQPADPNCTKALAHTINAEPSAKNKGWIVWGARVQNASCNIMENTTLRTFLQAELKYGLTFP
jgi:hypothetical protein